MSHPEPTPGSSSSSAAPGQPSSTADQSTGYSQSYPYYSNLPSWAHAAGSYPYGGVYTGPSQSQGTFVPYQTSYPLNYNFASSWAYSKPRTPPPLSPSPPPPESYYEWDKAIHSFLVRLGLTQAAAGFENDILVINPTWERDNVPGALAELSKRISSIVAAKSVDASDLGSEGENASGTRSLEERKLDHVHLAEGFTPQSQSQINKQISLFLARNRARNDASNRAEFLNKPAQKHRSDAEMVVDANDTALASCARVDAKPLNRDVQMKYDVAWNEDGPLSRTVFANGEKKGSEQKDGSPASSGEKREGVSITASLHVKGGNDESNWTAKRHPGLDERLNNIEDHLAVRYVPSSPRTLLTRLEYLEKHIIRLEKDYPPWAALHFNQPNRGWPPPPRQTPIIVPPHLRDVVNKDSVVTGGEKHGSSGVEGKPRKTNSSLHRAVLERLEVKKAMSDLAGDG